MLIKGPWCSAFTTLAATPSFAPLSLILLALLARVYKLLGVTAYIHVLGDAEEQEQLARDEQEMQDALAKFAEVDAANLWEANNQENITTACGDNELDGTSDIGEVVSRKTTIQEDAASLSVSTKKTPVKAIYQSKIRSSPLILSEEESSKPPKTNRNATTELPKIKRKLKIEDSDVTQQSGISRKKKKKKSNNAIDALFAGLG